jgi:hypothetical protein
MVDRPSEGAPDRSPAGLCARCGHLRTQATRRGTTFYRCARADTDQRFLRYPPIPVRACPGFEPAGGDAREDA